MAGKPVPFPTAPAILALAEKHKLSMKPGQGTFLRGGLWGQPLFGCPVAALALEKCGGDAGQVATFDRYVTGTSRNIRFRRGLSDGFEGMAPWLSDENYTQGFATGRDVATLLGKDWDHRATISFEPLPAVAYE